MYPNKTLLFITNTPLTPHAYRTFGVNTTYKGWKIVYWNILPFVNKKLDQEYSNKSIKLRKDKHYIKINSLYDLFKEYKNIPDKFFYINGVENVILISLLDRVLNFSGGTKISVRTEAFPPIKKKYFEIIKHLMANDKIYLLKKVLPVFLSKTIIYLSRNILQPKSEIFFATNQQNYLYMKKKFKNKKIFKIDSVNFEYFNKFKKKKIKSDKKIIFIDQGHENHFDTKIVFYVKKGKLGQNYWNAINKLLNFLPKKINSNGLVIAANRRRFKFDTPSNKKFIFNKTFELIQKSKLVVGHDSTAIRLAVLLNKPIVIVNLHLFKLYNYQGYLGTNALAKELGSQVIYIDKNYNFNKKIIKEKNLTKINKEKYKKFEKYIGFPKLKSYGTWKTVLQHLDNFKI